MSSVHLFKRAVQVGADTLTGVSKENGGNGPKHIDIPPWGFALFTLTSMAFIVFWVMISYTLEEVVATLTMVETPMAAIRLEDSAHEPLTKPSDEPASAIPAESQPKPVTRSIRSTIQHISAQGGFKARWRGFSLFIVYSVLGGMVNGFLSFLMPIHGLSIFVVTVLLAPIHAGWTHAIIAAPSNKSWWSRILPRSSYKALIVPTLAYAASHVLLAFVAVGTTMLAQSHRNSSLFAVVGRPMIATLIYISVALFVVLPAAVALARVEASLLPADEDTIVPFDRTFNGKVEPIELGGTGVLSFGDAWRTFDWEARRRLIKLYVKILAIAIALFFAAVLVMVSEGIFVLGQSEFKDAARQGIDRVRDLKF